MCVPVQGLRCARSTPRRVTLPEDVVRREANRVYSERLWVGGKGDMIGALPGRRQGHGGRKLPSSLNPWEGLTKRRMETEEGEVTPPPHSPLLEVLHSLGDIFNRQAGIFVGARQPKWPETRIGSPTGPSLQPHHALVSLDLQGVSVVLGVMGMSQLLGVLKVLPFLPAVGAATDLLAELSS
jgi:hypothetical protein